MADIISTFSSGTYEAKITKTFDNLFTVSYFIGERQIRKSTHISLDLAEDVAKDFISEGTNSPQLLNE